MKTLIPTVAVALLTITACEKTAEDTPCTYSVTGWTECVNGVRYRTVSVSPDGCVGPVPANSEACTEPCRTNRTGRLVVRNNSPDAYRVYYQQVVALPPPENLWGIVAPFQSDTLTLDDALYRMRAVREGPSPAESVDTLYVALCTLEYWLFP